MNVRVYLLVSDSGARAILGTRAGRYDPGVGQIYLDEVRCTGNEEMLVNCSTQGVGEHDCDHSEDAGVRCEGTQQTKIVILLNYHFPGE